MERRIIWLLCVAYILLQVADALTTHFALSTSPYLHEANPLLAHLFSQYGTAQSLALKVLFASLPAFGFAFLGTFTQTQKKFEKASFWGLLAGVVFMSALVLWNSSLILMVM